jgi:hypothetical protein
MKAIGQPMLRGFAPNCPGEFVTQLIIFIIRAKGCAHFDLLTPEQTYPRSPTRCDSYPIASGAKVLAGGSDKTYGTDRKGEAIGAGRSVAMWSFGWFEVGEMLHQFARSSEMFGKEYAGGFIPADRHLFYKASMPGVFQRQTSKIRHLIIVDTAQCDNIEFERSETGAFGCKDSILNALESIRADDLRKALALQRV